MADKIREALFSVLGSLGVEADRVLDLYAGTGAIGIEALSRGAEWCDFVEQNAAAAQVVRDNLETVGFAARGRVHQLATLGFLRNVMEPYNLVVLDPPYADPDIIMTLQAIACSRAVEDGTIVVIGHSPRVALPDRIDRLEKLRGRCHGDSCFAVFDVVEGVQEPHGVS